MHFGIVMAITGGDVEFPIRDLATFGALDAPLGRTVKVMPVSVGTWTCDVSTYSFRGSPCTVYAHRPRRAVFAGFANPSHTFVAAAMVESLVGAHDARNFSARDAAGSCNILQLLTQR